MCSHLNPQAGKTFYGIQTGRGVFRGVSFYCNMEYACSWSAVHGLLLKSIGYLYSGCQLLFLLTYLFKQTSVCCSVSQGDGQLLNVTAQSRAQDACVLPLGLTQGHWGCLNLRLGQKNVNRKLSGKEAEEVKFK